MHLRAKVKEVSTPKFYFFDCGIVRALRNELHQDLREDRGFLLETFVFNELQAYASYSRLNYEFYYWATPGKTEVDFVICQGKKMWALEVKASRNWKKEFNHGLLSISDSKKIKSCFGVYLGSENLKIDQIKIFSVKEFCRKLHSGELFD